MPEFVRSLFPHFRLLVIGTIFLGGLSGGWVTAEAQPAAKGVITGRVLNPATGEYFRNATVEVVGGESVATEDDGSYRLSGVTAGEVEMVVSYTGYRSARAQMHVEAGSSARHDFELVSSLTPETAAGSAIALSAFVVSGEREGNAKAIMDQRKSMNITNHVSSDAFGDIAEGNIGEFIKKMPGVDTDSLDGTVRYVRLRGLPSDYASVTINGIGLASADAGAALSSARAFSFEQVSLSSIESIEISKTVSADVDANAPAGTINLKTKRAFDRKGRRTSVQASLSAQSDQLTFDRTYGPGDDKQRKILPSARLEYSDIFLKNRLGVVFSVSESNAYIQREPVTVGWNYVPTALSLAPITMTNLRAQQINQTVRRSASMLTVDFKATPGLVLSLSGMYNFADTWSGQRSWLFTTGDRASAVTGDPLRNFTTTHPQARLNTESLAVAKRGTGMTIIPSLEYKKGDFLLEARAAYSVSDSNYDPMGFHGSVYSGGEFQVRPATFKAQRSKLNGADWKFTEVAGSDWNNGVNYTTAPISLEDGRYARSEIDSGEISASTKTRVGLPFAWKTGLKTKSETRKFENDREAYLYNYTGPGAALPGALANLRTPVPLDFGDDGFRATSITGQDGSPFVSDNQRIAALFREHPEYFTRSFTATNYYNAYILNNRRYEEQIDAAFAMATANLARGLTGRIGFRWEETNTKAREADPRSATDVVAAGFAVSAGRATTIPGLQYQYQSRAKVDRKGSYDNFFPSGSLKYEVLKDLDLQLGYSRTIRRPSIDNLAGVWTVDDTTLTVNAPNANLKPEISDNVSLRLVRYFEPIGSLAANFYQNEVKGLFQTAELTAEQFGYTGDVYQNYLFRTTRSASDRTISIRGMELEYNQTLSFLPHPFDRLNLRVAYTRNTAETIVEGMAPHLVVGGLSYALGRLSLNSSVNWAGDTAQDSTGVFLRHRFQLDAGGSYRVYQNWQFFTSLRNVSDAPYIVMEKKGAANPALSRLYQKFGVTTTMGLRATF